MNDVNLRLGDWQQLRFSLLRCYKRNVLPPHRCVRLNRPDSWSLWVLERGTAEIVLHDGTRVGAEAGSLFQPPPAISRVQHFSDDARMISIGWYAHWVDGFAMFAHEHALVLPCGQFPELVAASNALHRVTGDVFDNPTAALPVEQWSSMETAFHAWLTAWFRMMDEVGFQVCEPREHDPRLLRAMELIRTAVMSGPVPFGAICNHLRLSRVQIDRLFRNELGMTPKEYQNRQLLIQVKELLYRSNDSLKEISHRFGFSSPAHFSTWFRRQTNQSPQEYRHSSIA